jgi:hypothetical protein
MSLCMPLGEVNVDHILTCNFISTLSDLSIPQFLTLRGSLASHGRQGLQLQNLHVN